MTNISKTNTQITQIALFPFIGALALNVARILVSIKPGNYAYNNFGRCCVSLERYAVVVVFILVLLDWIFGARATQHSLYVATMFSLTLHASTERVLNVITAFLVFRVLELPFGKFRLFDFAQKACVFMLFCLVAIPETNLTALLFSRPRFLIRE
jgi:hypothetical protein